MSTIKKQGMDKVLPFILLLAAFLYGFDIWKDKYANLFYTTAVGSMLQSFHNFFYGSLDSAGSVTVDKPPVTFWIQSLSAMVFGVHGWSVILPQVLSGVGSVLLLYLLIRPTFGRGAARIGALAMAVTPVAAAVSRTNNIDAMLVFTLLLAVWFLFRGVRSSRTGSIIAAFAIVGVGFNEKMLQAYMVLPAFFLFYLLAAKAGWKRKAGVLAASTAVLAIVSLSWAVTVDSIPADKRPFIGSSGTNSVLNLAFGYNGVSRLTGDRSTGGAPGGFGGGMPGWNGQVPGGNGSFDANNGEGPFGMPGRNGGDGRGGFRDRGNADSGQGVPGGGHNPASTGNGQPSGFGGDRTGRQFDWGQGGRGGAGGMFHTGTPGPLRLFQSDLSGQASWLLPLVAAACLGLLSSLRRRHFTAKHKEAVFWLAWLIPVMGFFSIAGFFHQYYLIMMAPPIAALAGGGWMELWTLYRERSGWRSWLLPAAVLATAALQWYILHPYDDTIGRGWSIGIAAAGTAAAILLMLFKGRTQSLVSGAVVVSLLILMIGPLYWAATPITYGSNSMTPAAGPDSSEGPGGIRFSNGDSRGGFLRGGGEGVNENLLAYLEAHNGGQQYLFAAMDYGTAGPYIIDKDASVMVLNGFNASDKVYTPDSLKAMVESGQVKYFLISGSGMGGGRGGSAELTSWITENGTEVPAADWQGTDTASNDKLYEVTLK